MRHLVVNLGTKLNFFSSPYRSAIVSILISAILCFGTFFRNKNVIVVWMALTILESVLIGVQAILSLNVCIEFIQGNNQPYQLTIGKSKF